MATYRVAAKRWDKGWQLHIDDVGVTQARRPAEFREIARDLIVRCEFVSASSIRLEWILDGAVTALLPDERALLEVIATVPSSVVDASDALLPPWPRSSSRGSRRRWRTRSIELFRAWQVLMADGLISVAGLTECGHYQYGITAAGREVLAVRSYAEKVDEPLSAESVAALNAELASGSYARDRRAGSAPKEET